MRIFYLLTLFFFCTACEELFEYHPNQITLEEHERNLTAKSIERLQQQQPGDTIRFVLMGDTQRFYDEAADFVEHVSALHRQTPIDFVIHAGDISDFGMQKEFRWVHDILKELPVPYLTVIGNHDLLANGSAIYAQMYGPENYYVDYGFARFIFLNTNSREYGFSGKVPDLNWLSQALPEVPTPEPISREYFPLKQTLLISHIPPFDADFDPALEAAYAQKLGKHPLVNMSLHGHQHDWRAEEVYGDGVHYQVISSQKDRKYGLVSLWAEGFSVEPISF